MGRSEWAMDRDWGRAFEQTGRAVDSGDFDGLRELHRGQKARQPLGQHGLAGARRAPEKNRMAAGRRDFQRALGALLAADIREIGNTAIRRFRSCDFGFG